MANPTSRLEHAITRQHEAIDLLATALVAHGEPAGAPFAGLAVPSPDALRRLDAATLADWGIALVHLVFRTRSLPRAVTDATKQVGNAARRVRRVLEREQRRESEAARSRAPRSTLFPVPPREPGADLHSTGGEPARAG